MKLPRKMCPTSFSTAGWLLACTLGAAAQADVGPALSGITARANDASTVFWSPAGITRIEQPELVMQATLVAMRILTSASCWCRVRITLILLMSVGVQAFR